MPPKSSAKAGAKPPVSTSQPQKATWKGKDHKTAPNSNSKQPLPLPERLKRLFTSLCAQIDGGHFANAVKTCDKILRLDPKDPDARQTKLFLLLQTEQYTAALNLIDESSSSTDDPDPNPNPGRYAYERAYTLYRLQREADARDVLASLKEKREKREEGVGMELEGTQERGVVHLEAQLNYREGAYQAAVDLYNELLDTAEPNTEEHADILTNLTAAQQHLEFINTGFLRAIDALPPSVTSTLESAPPPVPPSASASSLSPSTGLPAASSAQPLFPEAHPPKPTPKQPRKSRIPPGVIPGVTPPPDPERWVKKSERSTFGAGQGRRRKGAGGGGGGGATQGAGVVDGVGVGGVQQPAGGAGAGAGQGQGKSGGGGGKGKKRK